MSTIGALITAVIFGAIAYGATGWPAAFWVLFCFSALIGVPIGCIMDLARGAREQREYRADVRMEEQSDAIAAAIVRGRPNVNIDARAVHYHGNDPERVLKP